MLEMLRPVRVPEGNRKPGGSTLVGDLRGMVLREHLRDLMTVHQPQVSSLEGLSSLGHPLDAEPLEIKIGGEPFPEPDDH
ncbi:hypothetical protein [Hyalangium versicolor]|uniref:hypothetical protein n=1 Tax=Hyalangium versicolor TaxID=2861190 RepID=UPI001CCA3EB0|nr:hypothetical protein [Hyalangium versicolor]